MTLPIALVRPAPEPASPPASSSPHDDATGGTFGAALATAMVGSPEPLREGSSRRIRGSRELAGNVSHSTNADAPTDESESVTPETIDLAADARATFIGVGERVSSGEARTGELPGHASADEVRDESSPEGATGRELALTDRFEATTLEHVMDAVPLALVQGAGGQGAATTTPAVHGAPSTTSPSLVIAQPSSASLESAEARLSAIEASIEKAMTRDPLAVRREVEALAPELRTRLERVIARMEQEYGYTVEVVETVRTQERQDALFAQGRTQPGPVVTWTRQSRHLDGAAADVVIDGGYTNASGFERLARVAREEGLRTLWPRDPGHVELATPNAQAVSETAARPARTARSENGEVHILPVREGEVHALPIPRATRSAIDPRAGRAMPNETVPSAGEGRHDDGVPRILPFPNPALPPTEAAGVAPGRVRLPVVGGPVFTAPGSVIQPPVQAGTTIASPRSIAAVVATSATESVGTAPIAAAPATAGPLATGIARVAHVAQVAPVASVATVARVADVATVATPGALGGPAPATPPLVAPGPVVAQGDRAPTSGRQDSGAGHESGERERADMLASALLSREDQDAARLALTRELGTPSSDDRATSSVAGLSRSDATERIARVLRIQESGSDRPLSSVMLRLDHPDGGEDRIRIDLRGRTIGATLDVADPRAAEQLRAHTPELQQALQRQGLEGEAMVVRTTGRTTDSAVLNASAAAAERDVARAASATASDGGGSTAKDSRTPPRASYERDGTDQQRSRQRRDGKDNTR